MNQYDFKEFRILRCPHRGKYDNLTLTIELSKEDAPLELELYLRKCWQDGVMLKAEIDEIEEIKAENPVFSKAALLSAKNILTHNLDEDGKKISKPSIYQEFKWFCERNGKDYEREKIKILTGLGLDILEGEFIHMKALEQFRTPEQMEAILINRMEEIKNELGFYSETN